MLKSNASLRVGFACDCPAFSTDCPASCRSPRQTWCVICYPNQEVQSQGSKNEGKGEARQGSRESKYKLLLRVGPTFKRKRADAWSCGWLISRQTAPSHGSCEPSGTRKEEEHVCQFLTVSYLSWVRVHHMECEALCNSRLCHLSPSLSQKLLGKPHCTIPVAGLLLSLRVVRETIVTKGTMGKGSLFHFPKRKFPKRKWNA